jgi:NADH-quinone oxidoreductase subunit E
MDYTVKTRCTTGNYSRWTFKGVECLGACGYAPMMQLGDFTKHLTRKIDQLIIDCKDGKIILQDS